MIGRWQERALPTITTPEYILLLLVYPLDFQNFRAELAGPNRELSFLVHTYLATLVLGF